MIVEKKSKAGCSQKRKLLHENKKCVNTCDSVLKDCLERQKPELNIFNSTYHAVALLEPNHKKSILGQS